MDALHDEESSADLQRVRLENGHYLLEGVIRHHLFMGSYYRYMVEIEGQPIFVDEAYLELGPCLVRIAQEKAYWFDA
nr:TOBE domain-containing protein [Paenibacillus aestuarii]